MARQEYMDVMGKWKYEESDQGIINSSNYSHFFMHYRHMDLL